MTTTQLAKLQGKIFGKNHQDELNLAMLFKEFSCVELITGAEYEVQDKEGNVLYFIKKRPVNVKQFNQINKILLEYKKEEEKQSKSHKRR